jgi:exodeoxyribonuclease V beta subunit
VAFHEPTTGFRHTIDVGLEGPGYKRHADQFLIEQRGEDLRLAYVALTRAQHQAVVWWVGSKDSANGPLTRLLFSNDSAGDVKAFGSPTPTDSAAIKRLEELAASARGRISVERATLGGPAAWSPPLERPAELRAARFDRQLDLNWRRTSYTDITAEAHEPLVASEPEQSSLGDEPEAPTPAPVAESLPELDRPSPLGELPVGVRFGSFAHAVFEASDFAAADLDAELAAQADAAGARWGLDAGDRASAAAGLRAAIETPIGPVLGGLRLRDVARPDRLDELEFELPLVGGEDPTGRLTLGALARVLRDGLPESDPMAAYAVRLEDPALRSNVRGFLTGSLDLVVRLDGPRFAVVDYKTNWLGPADEPLTLRHYHPRAVAEEMYRAQYGLQALLYTVALHRYLRWRLPGYDPGQHLAGVLYLFVRGMAGADTPILDGIPCGVFAWTPPGALVRALSDVLDQGMPS